MILDTENFNPPGAKIKIVGIGGGGGNAVNTMIQNGLHGIDFIVINTDLQSLKYSLAKHKIQIGKDLTKGLGAGANPDIGRDAALEDRHELQEMLSDADMVFITAGMGGGTGTGAASIVAQIAKELGTLTVAVVTTPFDFEGKRRKRHAGIGIERLREHVDTLITIPNQRLLSVASEDISLIEAFRIADNVLVNAVRGISDIISLPGTINVDFADVKTVMSSMGQAIMGIGFSSGKERATQASRQAIASPLLEEINIEGATGILINVTAGENITLRELHEACAVVQGAAHEDANVIFGAVIDENMSDEIRVTVIATGFPVDRFAEKTDSVSPSPLQKLTRAKANTTTSVQVAPPEQPAPVPTQPKVEVQPVPEPQHFAPEPQPLPYTPPVSATVPRPVASTLASQPALDAVPSQPALDAVPSQPALDLPETSASNIAADIDSHIDEAIQLAGRTNPTQNLDVPAFMRSGPKELPS